MTEEQSGFDHFKWLAWSAVWGANPAQLPPLRAGLVRYARIAHMTVREIAELRLSSQAASLVYSTLLSIVPVLAVSFSLLKGFGVHFEIQEVLHTLLEPLGSKGRELGDQVIQYVDNINAAKLGTLSLAVLLVTVVSVVHKVEQALNALWRVTKPRGWVGRFSGYLTVMLIGPVLVFTAMGLTAWVMSSSVVQHIMAFASFGALVAFGSKLVPYLLVAGALLFVYIFMPNTKVHFRSALVGALVAGFLWALAGWGFGTFVVTSSKYPAIYSGVAIFLLTMIWLYIGWLIVLVGGSVAFYHQHPEYHGFLPHERPFSNRLRTWLALTATFLIAQSFQHDRRPWTSQALAKELGVPLEPFEKLLKALRNRSILMEVNTDPVAWAPGRPLEQIPVKEVLDTVAAAGESHHLTLDSLPTHEVITHLAQTVDDAVAAALREQTLRDLVVDRPPSSESFPGDDAAAPEPAPITTINREGIKREGRGSSAG